jgi:Cupin superfamily (DUF985)
MHRLKSDEVFHFYMGDAVEMLRLYPGGRGERVLIGTNLAAGQRPQVVVEKNIWQGSRLVAGGSWALLGCSVSPGFEFEDYEAGVREELLAGWPGWGELVVGLTRWGLFVVSCWLKNEQRQSESNPPLREGWQLKSKSESNRKSKCNPQVLRLQRQSAPLSLRMTIFSGVARKNKQQEEQKQKRRQLQLQKQLQKRNTGVSPLRRKRRRLRSRWRSFGWGAEEPDFGGYLSLGFRTVSL